MVDDLAKEFAVSTVTIRSDLNELDKSGLVVRCRSGAIASTQLSKELFVRERYKQHSSVKERLGKAVAGLVQAGESIIVDACEISYPT